MHNIPVVILAGGFGTRISEESHIRPKPMVEIGDKPILWHIMKIYSQFGFNDFIICLGYKGYCIKEFFANYFLHSSNVTFDFTKPQQKLVTHSHSAEPWRVTLVDTGLNTMTGGRLKRVAHYIGNRTFMLTYGDGVGDIDLKALYELHQRKKKCVTMTSTKPPSRFGVLELNRDSDVLGFREKPEGEGSWINAGFFVIEPQFFEYLSDDFCVLEKEPLERVAAHGQLAALKHSGFWQPIDTLRDKTLLEKLWNENKAPWKIWQES